MEVTHIVKKYAEQLENIAEKLVAIKKNIKVVQNTEVEYAGRRERYVNIPHVILIELLESNFYTLCR